MTTSTLSRATNEADSAKPHLVGPTAPELNYRTNFSLYLTIRALAWLFTALSASLPLDALATSVAAGGIGGSNSDLTWSVAIAFAVWGGVWGAVWTTLLVWKRYLLYKERWYLSEVAHLVHGYYDIPWSRISQATQYRPQSKPFWRFYKNRLYSLQSKEDWLDGSRIKLKIDVPVRKGANIVVTQHVNGVMAVPPIREVPTDAVTGDRSGPLSTGVVVLLGLLLMTGAAALASRK
jgi:hypothetical protein